MQRSSSLVATALALSLSIIIGCAPAPPPGDSGGNGGGGSGSGSDDNSGIPDAPGTGTVGDGVIVENIFSPGKVIVPQGVSFTASDLRVVTNFESAPVAADGQFTVQAATNYSTLIQVVDQEGNIVMISWHPWILLRDPPEVSTKTTAAAILYMAVGGWSLPPEATSDLLFEIENSDAVQRLADVIAVALTKDRRALNCDPDVNESVEMETINLINEISDDIAGNLEGKFAAKTRGEVGRDALVSVSPTSVQGGIRMIAEDDTPTFTAQNLFARSGLLYLLETAYEDLEGNRTEHDVYQQIGEPIPIPDARTLSGQFNASLAIASITLTDLDRAVWENREVGPLDLPQHENASRTEYELVFLGPSFNPIDSATLNATQYANVRSEWEEKLEELRLESFVFKVLIPLSEQMGLGVNVSTIFDQQPEAGRTLAQLILPILEGAGVELTSRDGYVEALRVVIDRFMNNQLFRFDLINALTLAYNARTAEQIDTVQMAGGMQRLVQMESFMLAIYNSFDNRDVAQVVNHLAQSNDIEFWDAEVASVKLSPSPVRLTETILSKDISAFVAGNQALPITYEWSTTGDNGFIVAALTDPEDGDTTTSFTTTESMARYRATSFVIGDIDKVTVRATDANGVFLGAATTSIEGVDVPENECDGFPQDEYQRGSRLRIVEANTEIVGGENLNVRISYNVPSGGSSSVQVFVSAGCSRCNIGCFCGLGETDGVEVDGQSGINTTDHGWVLFQHKDGADFTQLQANCMVSTSKSFSNPNDAEDVTMEAEFSFPISPDWPGCDPEAETCGCPYLGDIFTDFEGNTDPRVEVWHGYFIVARAGTFEQAVQTLTFARDPGFDPETAYDCPDEE
ncbi:MAG: hypothetical protein DHS20C16_01040 [Phycisphaerae bacterium]|nr:MAG: hypothetical protein DHS20C16_01040 [Phycisphaerae bacterium]